MTAPGSRARRRPQRLARPAHVAERALAERRDGEDALALAAARRRDFAERRVEEALGFHPLERGVDVAHRDLAAHFLFEKLLHRNAVRALAQCRHRQQGQLFEFTETIALHDPKQYHG